MVNSSEKVKQFEFEPRLVIVIPTRNRLNELKLLVKDISSLKGRLPEVLFIDSSDIPIQKQDIEIKKFKVIYSRLKSAAHQRNLALKLLYREPEFVTVTHLLFLDDDVRIESNYIEGLLTRLSEDSYLIGVAPQVNEEQSRHSLIEDKFAGRLLPGAINVSSSRVLPDAKVDWLIGCSLWNFNKLKKQQFYFEGDFLGQSIFEDVIFSSRTRQLGGVLGVSKEHLQHNLSPIERPRTKELMSDWVMHRYRYIDIFGRSKLTFFFVNSLMLIRQLINLLDKQRIASLKGLVYGNLRILRSL